LYDYDLINVQVVCHSCVSSMLVLCEYYMISMALLCEYYVTCVMLFRDDGVMSM